MKKKQITFERKLSLDKSIISKLDATQMDALVGGSVNTATCVDAVAEELEAQSCKACSCNSPTKY
ncbi:class I lanthipeptide [Arcicella aquatica]|uniref:Class I lanthipeptide n=1 Tax=Arcicella aquatica TaxID=217141 RepID=A0ABU5QLK9_9BACT|nr:class I lanthipeptide [Arcicella aquatica]MEA5257947.1 class I lanthipeptide [Arcicella aquatica]